MLGERTRAHTAARLRQRQEQWNSVNARWDIECPRGLRFYSEVLSCNPASMQVVGLVEDGMFEEGIQSSVALFAETLWNPRRSPEEIREQTQSFYYG